MATGGTAASETVARDAPGAADLADRIRRLAVLLGLLGAAYCAYAVWLNPSRPHGPAAPGYYAFVDQSAYLRSARILAKFLVPVGSYRYFYGLGYPVLGAVFIKLGFRGDPFAPADVLLFGGICALTFVLAVRLWRVAFGVVSPIAALITVAIVVFGTPLFHSTLQPWNSTLVVFLLLVVLTLVTSQRAVTWGRAIAIGLLLGWIFATRYGDVLFAGLPVAAAVLIRSRTEGARLVTGGVVALFTVVALVGYTQYHAFGNAFLTPYHFHTRSTSGLGNDQSLENYRINWIPSHFFSEVITGRSKGSRNANPMLAQFPLLPFAPVGAAAVLRRAGRDRAVWIAVTVASTFSSLFYLSFVAGGGGDLAFGNLRYWAIWYPLWAIAAVIGAKIAIQRMELVLGRVKARAPSRATVDAT